MSQAVANQQPTADSAAPHSNPGKKDNDTNPIPTGNDIAKSEIGGKVSPSDNDKPSNSQPVNQIEKSSGNNIMSVEKVNVNGLEKLTQPLPPTNAHDGQHNSIAKVASSNSSSTNPMPSTKKENKKDHSDRGTKEKADNSSSVSAPKHSDQVFVATTTKTLSSPTPPSGKNDSMTAAPKENPDIIKDTDDKKQSGSMISSQDQPSNAGGESNTPTSPSKKKSKKKRKKKVSSISFYYIYPILYLICYLHILF